MIGWGILGNATIARLAVVPAIVRAHNSYVAAIGSRSLSRAEELTSQFQGDAVEGYEAVLAHPSVRAVYIPLPNHLHKEWTLKALAAGKHVLVEKPFALNASEAHEMAAAASQAGRLLSEAVMWRYHPRSKRIHQLVQAGELGTIGSIRAAFTFSVLPNEQNRRLFSRAMGGGSLLDVGTYAVGLARWLLQAEPISVTAQAIWNEDDVDINFVGTLSFAAGTLVNLESSFCTTLQQLYTVSGNKGAIEFPHHDAFIPGPNECSFVRRSANAEIGEIINVSGADQYQLMIEHFSDAIMGETRLVQTPVDSIRQMEVLDALQQAARLQRTITL